MVEHFSPSLHIQKFALDIAHRLSSLPDFLEASEHLLSHDHLFTNAVIEHHGRKVGFALSCHSYNSHKQKRQLLAIIEVIICSCYLSSSATK